MYIRGPKKPSTGDKHFKLMCLSVWKWQCCVWKHAYVQPRWMYGDEEGGREWEGGMYALCTYACSMHLFMHLFKQCLTPFAAWWIGVASPTIFCPSPMLHSNQGINHRKSPQWLPCPRIIWNRQTNKRDSWRNEIWCFNRPGARNGAQTCNQQDTCGFAFQVFQVESGSSETGLAPASGIW